VEHNELVGTGVVEPLIQGSCFPEWVEVEADGVRRRDHSTRDDVVPIEQAASDWFTDAIDVNWSCCYEGCHVGQRGQGQHREHEETEPTDVEPVG